MNLLFIIIILRCIPKRRVCLTNMTDYPCLQYECVSRPAGCDPNQLDPACDTDNMEHANLCLLYQQGKTLAYMGHCQVHSQWNFIKVYNEVKLWIWIPFAQTKCPVFVFFCFVVSRPLFYMHIMLKTSPPLAVNKCSAYAEACWKSVPGGPSWSYLRECQECLKLFQDKNGSFEWRR